MRLIRKGKAVIEVKATCKQCGSLFAYTKSDVKLMTYIYKENRKGYGVWCPVCSALHITPKWK